jgi:hypothetical protein
VLPRERRHLRGDPNGGRAVRNLHRAIHRLDRAMCEIRCVVLGADRSRRAAQCSVDVTAVVVGVAVAVVQCLRKLGVHVCARQRGCGAVIPHHVDRTHRVHRAERVVGDYRDAAAATSVGLQRKRLDETRHALGRRSVEMRHRPAQRGAHHHARIDETVRQRVNAEARRAVDFRRGFDTPHRLADQFELSGIFQRDLAWQRLLCGHRGQLAEARLVACCVHYVAAFRMALAG